MYRSLHWDTMWDVLLKCSLTPDYKVGIVFYSPDTYNAFISKVLDDHDIDMYSAFRSMDWFETGSCTPRWSFLDGHTTVRFEHNGSSIELFPVGFPLVGISYDELLYDPALMPINQSIDIDCPEGGRYFAIRGDKIVSEFPTSPYGAWQYVWGFISEEGAQRQEECEQSEELDKFLNGFRIIREGGQASGG